MSRDYVDEPIGKLFQRAKKGNLFMQGLRKKDRDYGKWLKRYLGVVDHLLSRLEWLEAIRMFADKKLMSDDD